MDRQERGRHLAQAQGQRIRPIEGPLWFVPSESTGSGYVVHVEKGQCSCPDAQKGQRCKHVWAVESMRSLPAEGGELVPAKPATWPKGRKGDLTAQEQSNVRAALRFLRTRSGGYVPLSKAIGMQEKTMQPMARRVPPSAGLAVRLARLAGVPVDDVLCGRYPAPGTCPHCGRSPE